MTATLNGSACTCLNRFDRCAHCRAKDAEAKANPTPRPTPPPPPPAPKAKPTPAVKEAAMLLSVAEVARLLGVGVRTVWRLTEQGHFVRPMRWSRKLIRWNRADVLAWVENAAKDAREGQP